MSDRNKNVAAQEKARKEITWKGLIVGFSSGAVVASLFAVIFIVSLKQGYIADINENREIKAELKKYKTQFAEDMLSRARYNEFVEKLKEAKLNAERQDIITYYHPWPSDPPQYVNNWRTSYRQLRSVLWDEIELYKDNQPGEYLRQIIRLGLWSKIIGEKRDAQDCFEIVLDFVQEYPFKVEDYVKGGYIDPAYKELGYAERYKIPSYIDEIEHNKIYDILYQYDGVWVKPSKLKELKELEAKVKPPVVKDEEKPADSTE